VVILVSGGRDSATAVYEALEHGYEPDILHTSHGQRTEDKEYECAKALAEKVDAADFLHIETGHLS
jgi:7-cyano-7-deazaguanine synthase